VYEKEAWNPKTQTPAVALRRRLKVNYDLPMRDEFSEFIRRLLENTTQSSA
jgi:hypothetical protein